VAFGLVSTSTTGCSDDSGPAGFSCHKAGDKPCPNDTPTTQADESSCKKCEAENRAYDGCLGGAKCGTDGKTVDPDLTKCPTELQKLIACVTGTSADGGGPADAGDGG
jgi:hypothetical protein